MKHAIRSFALGLTLLAGIAGTASAGERILDGALGGAAGGLVLGPVGLVGGAIIGATAGPGIARSWGMKGSRSAHRSRYRAHRRYSQR